MYDRSPSPPVVARRYTRRRCNWLYVSVAACAFFLLFFAVPLPQQIEQPRNQIIQHVTDVAKNRLTEAMRDRIDYREPSLNTTTSKLAYATFMSHDLNKEDTDPKHDKYFIAVRMLIYQILYAPETRTQQDIPFIVLVNKDVSESKRRRLRRDGAIVWEAADVDAGWITTDNESWKSVLAKLRLWELTQFDRICFLDGDMVLTKNIDDIFNDPSVQLQTTGSMSNAIMSDEGKLPSTYVFAGMMELQPDHKYPPSEDFRDWPNINYLNAGFFILQPSMELLNYYFSLFETPDRFDPYLPEQNLMNYAHRRDGNMPWKQISQGWNVHYPTLEDLKGGAATLHDHWWSPWNAEIGPYMKTWRWRMEGYFESRDAMLAKIGI